MLVAFMNKLNHAELITRARRRVLKALALAIPCGTALTRTTRLSRSSHSTNVRTQNTNSLITGDS